MTDIHQRILKEANKHKGSMVAFLRDMVAIPSESGQERGIIQRIKAEMKKVGGWDRVHTDKMGNLFGRIGKAKPLIAIDAPSR